MASTVSEGTPGFLDHIHCSVCHRNLIASSDDTATVRSGEGALEDPFWMGECYHILCHREINGGQARDHKPLPSEIQAYCPKCSNTVYMVQLQLDQQFPGPAQRFLQPFETSLSEMVEAYRFKHMSDLISHLKGKVFEQKQLLARVKQDLQQAWQWEKDLEEARKENFALRQEIQTLRLQPIKMETGGASGSSAVHRAGDGRTTAERGYLQPPSRGATFQQPRPVSQRPPSQARPALASVQVQRHDCDPQSSRPLTRPSSCASDVFAFKPPPLSFRAIPPTTFATRSPDTGKLRRTSGVAPRSKVLTTADTEISA
ncbi:conserved hypothetical protein [Sporisorium reilianum SRZ2]|uniref:Uncharacterized protein n=1 Tax=Sporisorium reilianum (strain SRZ2) TaxID=999809 RepID=E7A0E3_SPORE|nr:conserved hypothetical protein [Sporisorium reilianum SRZ2]